MRVDDFARRGSGRADGLVWGPELPYAGAMRGSIVGAWVGVLVVLSAGCSPQPEGATQQPAAEAPKAEAKVEAKAEAKPAEELCAKGSDGWGACDGKRVRMEGRAPQMVMQHPMIGGGPPGVETVHQSYLEIEGGSQIIVLTKAPNACDGAMVVTGTLRSIDLGGEPGTKDSYKGWQVADATIECR